MKEAIRRIIYFACVVTLSSGEFEAKAGTLKYSFLNWLYGDEAQQA